MYVSLQNPSELGNKHYSHFTDWELRPKEAKGQIHKRIYV